MISEYYTRFFETKGAVFLLESIYVTSYSDLHCACLKHEDHTTVFFENMESDKYWKEFFQLICNEKQFSDYINGFQEYLIFAEDRCKTAIAEDRPEELIDIFLQFLDQYRFTESFYTDYSYWTLADEESVKPRFKQLESIKSKGRQFLNSFFNGERSFLSAMAKKTGATKEFYASTIDEIRNRIVPSAEQCCLRNSNHLLVGEQLYPEHSAEYNQVLQAIKNYNRNHDDIIIGVAASNGSVTGRAFVLDANFTNYDFLDKLITQMPDNSILVTETTSPDLINACYKAKGIVTNQGGLGSHAAIISRELGIPCVVGTKIATHFCMTGNLIEVDGTNGVVKLIEQK